MYKMMIKVLTKFCFSQVSFSASPSSFSIPQAVFSPYPAPLQPLTPASTEAEAVRLPDKTPVSGGQAARLQVAQAQKLSRSEETHPSFLVSVQEPEEPHVASRETGQGQPIPRGQPPLPVARQPRPRRPGFPQSSEALRHLRFVSI